MKNLKIGQEFIINESLINSYGVTKGIHYLCSKENEGIIVFDDFDRCNGLFSKERKPIGKVRITNLKQADLSDLKIKVI